MRRTTTRSRSNHELQLGRRGARCASDARTRVRLAAPQPRGSGGTRGGPSDPFAAAAFNVVELGRSAAVAVAGGEYPLGDIVGRREERAPQQVLVLAVLALHTFNAPLHGLDAQHHAGHIAELLYAHRVVQDLCGRDEEAAEVQLPFMQVPQWWQRDELSHVLGATVNYDPTVRQHAPVVQRQDVSLCGYGLLVELDELGPCVRTEGLEKAHRLHIGVYAGSVFAVDEILEHRHCRSFDCRFFTVLTII
ncbi:unnamed protein product [Sphagnum compactum]